MVNKTVTITETYKDRIILASANIFLYADNVIPFGNKTILFAITKASPLIDFENTWINGNTHVSDTNNINP